MSEKGKRVRYFLIILIYNFILAASAFVFQWLDRWFFQFNIGKWTAVDWWCFISIAILFGGILLYLAPWMERELYYRLDRRLMNLKIKLPKLEIKENNEYNEGNDTFVVPRGENENE